MDCGWDVGVGKDCWLGVGVGLAVVGVLVGLGFGVKVEVGETVVVEAGVGAVVGVAVGAVVGEGVGVGNNVKEAVMLPVPLIFAMVEPELKFSKVIKLLSAVHFENV